MNMNVRDMATARLATELLQDAARIVDEFRAIRVSVEAGAVTSTEAAGQIGTATAQVTGVQAQLNAFFAKYGDKIDAIGAMSEETLAAVAAQAPGIAAVAAQVAEVATVAANVDEILAAPSGAAQALAAAQEWAANPEDEEVADGLFSALHYAARSLAAASAAAESATAAAGNAAPLTGAVGQVAAILGQTQREVDRLSLAQEGGIYTLTTLLEALSVLGQISDQVNGGQVALRGGTLADPALRIGTVGVYSSAADTLSIAIAGSEVARFTASGLTVYGTITEV